MPDGQSWLALGFIFQILFDFAGYSDIAIGLALLFGVQLPYNFNAPFRSTNMQDLWQRWHMTLMTFLRDYLFHPLANARFGRGHRLLQYFAAMILTMALCGLWHGPSWTFVLWGTAQGVAVVTVSLWRRYGWRMPSLAGWAITMVFSLLLGVVFRAGSLEATWNVYQGLAILPDLERGRARAADHRGGACRLHAAGKPGHRGVAERTAAQGGCGRARPCGGCGACRTG